MIDKIKADLIAKTHYESIYKFCLVKLNYNSHDAADITQDVFLLFQEKCNRLEDKNIKGWLFSTANLKIKEYFKKHSKEEKTWTCIEDYDFEDDGADIFSLLEEHSTFDSENLEKYRNIIFDKLNENEKLLYTKVFVENKPYAQIADELNTTEKNIGVKVFRLKKKLNFMEAFVLCTVGQILIKLFF